MLWLLLYAYLGLYYTHSRFDNSIQMCERRRKKGKGPIKHARFTVVLFHISSHSIVVVQCIYIFRAMLFDRLKRARMVCMSLKRYLILLECVLRGKGINKTWPAMKFKQQESSRIICCCCRRCLSLFVLSIFFLKVENWLEWPDGKYDRAYKNAPFHLHFHTVEWILFFRFPLYSPFLFSNW